MNERLQNALTLLAVVTTIYIFIISVIDTYWFVTDVMSLQ
jgi:heme/copper-type cytochrome/quinol oxidase subunit 4